MENTQFLDSNSRNRVSRYVLLAYTTGYGTTRDVANAVGMVLSQAGVTVDIKLIQDIGELDNYDAIIIGSPIRYDTWMLEARRFVKTHQNRLSQLPVAFFFTCLTLSRQTEKARQQAISYANKLSRLSPQVTPLSVGRFAGALDVRKMSPFIRPFARLMMIFFRVSEGDYRDWEAIHAWAGTVHSSLFGSK